MLHAHFSAVPGADPGVWNTGHIPPPPPPPSFTANLLLEDNVASFLLFYVYNLAAALHRG